MFVCFTYFINDVDFTYFLYSRLLSATFEILIPLLYFSSSRIYLTYELINLKINFFSLYKTIYLVVDYCVHYIITLIFTFLEQKFSVFCSNTCDTPRRFFSLFLYSCLGTSWLSIFGENSRFNADLKSFHVLPRASYFMIHVKVSWRISFFCALIQSRRLIKVSLIHCFTFSFLSPLNVSIKSSTSIYLYV